MTKPSHPVVNLKENLHPRNRHRNAYDFPALTAALPQLAQHVSVNKYGNESVDFKNPEAVKTLNKALLLSFYGITAWDIPQGYLCPPIPGRVDYIHYMADLLSFANKKIIPRGALVNVLDIGTGANCIYPLLGHKEYGWQFVGTEIDDTAITAARKNVDSNGLAHSIEIRKQTIKAHFFKGIIKRNELFDVTVCNPPFHASLQEAQAGTERKWRNLGINKTGKQLNFGGKHAELWTDGGEERFVGDMIEESAQFAKSCLWFTSLLSKETTVKTCSQILDRVEAKQIEIIDMAQGQKSSRIIAWSFMDTAEHKSWAAKRWSGK
jgi:23S rRNA (adenine1618-N6)-methyltransferase